MAHWWSAQDGHVAYLALNETKVTTYTYPLYQFSRTDNRLPSLQHLRYPKTGTPNPIADLYVTGTRTDAVRFS